jgi:hypothetical protein
MMHFEQFVKEDCMDKNKISQEFIEAAFILGRELLNKEILTDTEREFLRHLDIISEFL